MKTEMISALMELFAMAYHSREKTAVKTEKKRDRRTRAWKQE